MELFEKMLIEKVLKTKHRQAGMTLIELMISIVLGLLLILAATAMTTKSMVMNTDTLKSFKLNQDLDSVIQVMVNDIRRAGFTGGTVGFFDNYADVNILDWGAGKTNNCLLYSYNIDYDNADVTTPEQSEKFGFRWGGGLTNPGSPIEMRTECDDTDCDIDCGKGSWTALTNTDVIFITDLSFDSLNSKCLGLETTDYWVTTTDSVTEFPCLASAGTNVTTYALDVNNVYQTGTFATPDTGDRWVGARQVNILLTAELANDESMVKSQQVAINVRNNQVLIK
jgi:prepilin peptidase dependent protein B